LSDLSLPDIKLIRDAMLGTLKSWAEESFDDPEKQTAQT